MLIVLFDYEVHHEYAPTGQTINKKYYIQILKRLRQAVKRKRPHFWSIEHLDSKTRRALGNR